MILPRQFFHLKPCDLAISLLGKVLRHRVILPDGQLVWLAARIIETEAYYLEERGSHSSLGLTEARRAMFMAPGTIYMYYARGGDSLNFSALGEGNGVLIKSGYPHFDRVSPDTTLAQMQRLNPGSQGDRPLDRLCNGQTLLCRSLGLKVTDWNQKQLQRDQFRLEDVGGHPSTIVQSVRLGIPEGRDEHLPFRFIDGDYARHCTKNPLTMRKRPDYRELPWQQRHSATADLPAAFQ